MRPTGKEGETWLQGLAFYARCEVRGRSAQGAVLHPPEKLCAERPPYYSTVHELGGKITH